MDHLGVSPQSIPEAFACPTALSLGHMEQLTDELRKAKEEDPVVAVVK